MSATLRRVAARAILAAGAAVVAIVAVRDCEDRRDDLTVIVDPRPLGDSVRAIRVDLFDRSGPRGSAERRFQPGETPTLVRLHAGTPGAGAELVIEIEAAAGTVQRVRRPIDAGGGSTVTVVLGDLTRAP